jgi:hypothetical protein
MRERMPAPGTPAGVVYGSHFGALIDGESNALWSAVVTGGNTTANTESGIWIGKPGAVSLLVRAGDPAPDTDSAFLSFSASGSYIALNAGNVVFAAGLRGNVTAANNSGVWLGSPGNLVLVARKGVPAPGTQAGVKYDGFGPRIALNSVGQTAFRSTLTGSGVTAANSYGVWVGGPGGVALLARSGDPAPGTAIGVSYGPFDNSPPVINAAGQVAFSVTTQVGSTGTGPRGIWVGTVGNVRLLARVGNAAPDTQPGVTIATISSSPALNAAGQTLFEGTVTGSGVSTSNDSGVWKGIPDSVAKVFREGDPAPGPGAGAVFGHVSNFGQSINDRGEVVFVNELTGPNVTTANDRSIWFVDAAGNFALVVREGDSFEVAPGDRRVLSDVNILGAPGFATIGGSGDETGRECGFNDRAQIAFRATFTDGSSGIFVASPAVRITDAQKVGDTFTLAVPSVTGNSYQLQRALSLTDEFVDLGSPQQGSTGLALTFTDPAAPNEQAFYRVEVRP